MSLNVHMVEAGAVLRVHQPFETRSRLVALRRLRRALSRAGLLVAEPLPIDGRELLRWEGRWAELERFVGHARPAPTWHSYRCMYAAMGDLHRGLRPLVDHVLPRPTIATYGPPATLRRWMRITREAVCHDSRAREIVTECGKLLRLLDRQWVAASRLPVQLVHGDVKLSNVVRSPYDRAAYLDFGFAARRPRVHELGYALSWIILGPDSSGRAEAFAWEQLDELIDAYEAGAQSRLTKLERASLGSYVAAVPLYMAAISGLLLTRWRIW